MSKIEDELLAEIEAYIAQHNLSPTRFGVLSINDGHLVHQLRAGALDIKASRINRIRAFMQGPPRPRRRVAGNVLVAA